MPDCNHCGAFVTPQFARVFGDNQDDVYGCHDCLAMAELSEGAASREGQ